ncbi:MAG: hypothetical protein K1X57_23070, partial [Gemmataceae bacterium]|nr:hypothetical protein [Gemmataceae bacterium]
VPPLPIPASPRATDVASVSSPLVVASSAVVVPQDLGCTPSAVSDPGMRSRRGFTPSVPVRDWRRAEMSSPLASGASAVTTKPADTASFASRVPESVATAPLPVAAQGMVSAVDYPVAAESEGTDPAEALPAFEGDSPSSNLVDRSDARNSASQAIQDVAAATVAQPGSVPPRHDAQVRFSQAASDGAEKIASTSRPRSSDAAQTRREDRSGLKVDSQIAEEKGLTSFKSTLGTEAANEPAPMLHEYRNTRFAPLTGETFSAAGGVEALSRGAGSASETAASAPVHASTAVQAIRQIADAADVLWATERQGVNLRLQLDDVGVAVRVEYRDGEIRTTIQTHSSDLRDALARAWDLQATSVADQKPYRFAEPVFTSASTSFSSAGGSAGGSGYSNGGDTSRHSSHSGQPDGGTAGFGFTSARSQGVPSSTVEGRVAAAVDSSRRLHAFA